MVTGEKIGGAGVITLNRPEKRNALHPELVNGVLRFLSEYNEDPNVFCIVLTGAGKSFCSGADLEYLRMLRKSSVLENEADSKLLSTLYSELYNSSKPTIAAVNGTAIAGGCGLVTVCDFAFAVPHAKFGYSEVKIGFLPALVSYFLVRRIGEYKALQLLLTAETISADEAEKLNLIDAVADDPLVDALSLAEQLSNNSLPMLIRLKKLIRETAAADSASAARFTRIENLLGRSSAEFSNAIDSFLNKP